MMIHEEHGLALSIDRLNDVTDLCFTAAKSRIEKGRGLGSGFLLFSLWIRVEEQGCSSPNRRHPILQVNRAKGHSGAGVAVEPEEAHTTAVPATWRFLEILNRLHGDWLG